MLKVANWSTGGLVEVVGFTSAGLSALDVILGGNVFAIGRSDFFFCFGCFLVFEVLEDFSDGFDAALLA